MFIRWKKRKCSKDRSYKYYLDVTLVENSRDDGKVKQRFIKHLASIPDDKGISWLLWMKASRRLDEMNLEKATRNTIERSIERRFPRDTSGTWRKQLAEAEAVVTKKGNHRKGQPRPMPA